MILLAINTKLHFQYRLTEKDNPFHLVFNPFHVPCPLQLSGFTLSFCAPCKAHATSSFIPCKTHATSSFLCKTHATSSFLCKTHATSMQNPRKKSCDSRTSTFVNFSDLNISLTVLYDKNMYLAIRVHSI